MAYADLLANPPITLRRVMDVLGNQDLDLLCELNSEWGLIDLMLEAQDLDNLRELLGYLEPLLLSPTITEDDLEKLIVGCGGEVFERSARALLTKLHYRAHMRLDASCRRQPHV